MGNSPSKSGGSCKKNGMRKNAGAARHVTAVPSVQTDNASHRRRVKFLCKYCNTAFREKTSAQMHMKACPSRPSSSTAEPRYPGTNLPGEKTTCSMNASGGAPRFQEIPGSSRNPASIKYAMPPLGKSEKAHHHSASSITKAQPDELRSHYNRERSGKSSELHPCKYCGLQCESVTKRLLHERIHSREKPYSCKYGKSTWVGKPSSGRQETISTKNQNNAGRSLVVNGSQESNKSSVSWQVDHSISDMPSDEQSNQHEEISRNHRHSSQSNPSKVCNHCGKKFNNVSNRVIHERTHTGEKPYSCKHCGHRMNAKGNMLKHEAICVKRQRRPNNNIFGRKKTGNDGVASADSRGVCAMMTVATAVVDQQLFLHSGPNKQSKSGGDKVTKPGGFRRGQEPVSKTCRHCGKQFANRNNLVQHERLHTGEKPYKCEYCGYRCAAHSNMIKHKSRCREKLKKNMEIQQELHQQPTVLTEVRSITLPPPTVETSPTTVSHIQLVAPTATDVIQRKRSPTSEGHHQSKIKHKETCRFCHMELSSTFHRIEHERIHTGEKPYECDRCGRRFAFNFAAKRHSTSCVKIPSEFIRKGLSYEPTSDQQDQNARRKDGAFQTLNKLESGSLSFNLTDKNLSSASPNSSARERNHKTATVIKTAENRNSSLISSSSIETETAAAKFFEGSAGGTDEPSTAFGNMGKVNSKYESSLASRSTSGEIDLPTRKFQWYPCKFCEQKFRSAMSRDGHEYSHTGEKPFACKYCPYRSRYKLNLARHEGICPFKN